MTTDWTFPRKRPAEQRRATRPGLRGLRAFGVTIGG
jgi:hypothetical protein